jgi:hypothetical protein
MPMALQVEQFGGDAGRMYFNETGSRQVFRWTRWGHASAALTTRSGLSVDPAEIP